MRRIFTVACLAFLLSFVSCHYNDDMGSPGENASSFLEVSEIILEGGETAAEISAFDPKTKKLFVTNAVKSTIEVIDMADPGNLLYEESLSISAFGAGVNSVAVKNGLLAAAIESDPKTNPGKVVIWNTSNLRAEPTIVTVGALPDMVTFTPNGRQIICANEGESAEDLSVDPYGSVSIIDVRNFNVTTLDFSRFSGFAEVLKKSGFRVIDPSGNFAADVEPEYVAVSDDSRYAWVTLQENNAIARVNLIFKTIEWIFPLGFKDHSFPSNKIDPSNRDGGVMHGSWPVRGMYLPGGIAFYSS